MSNQLPIVIGSHAAESGKKRVAAYCRVSSPSAEQLKSYQAQVDNYRKKFEKDDSVVFVGVYGDPGASGTRAANREGFMRMIDDCRRGEIDAIWTKSVSRFGRNTVDTLVYTRELRNLGIDVYFEKENIHSREPAGEMLLTMMAAFAESESFNMSENIKWGKHRRYEKGLVESISINNMLGLRQSNGVITVIEEEAEIVRRIFREYLEGYNMHEIAARLVNDGVRSRTDLPKWSATVIKHILTNEKFAGDCLLQKTYIADPIAHHSVPNRGEYAQFFVEDCYPTIVGKEEWLVVQEMMKRASNVTRPSSEEYPFVGKMYCSVCGQYFGQYTTATLNRERYSIYRCSSRKNHSWQIVPGMVYVRPHTVRYTKDPSPELVKYRERYCPESKPREYRCSDTRVALDRPRKAFVQAWNVILRKKQRYLSTLQAEQASDDIFTRYHASVLAGLLQVNEKLTEFDTRLFRKTVERIDVQPSGKMTFTFKAGIKITV